MLDTLTVYLAGPILGCSYGECTTWREYVRKELGNRCVVLSPMRGKEYLKDAEHIGQNYDKTLMSTGAAIVSRDFFDVMRSDIIFVNLIGANCVSIGTMIELGWASGETSKRRTSVIVMDHGNVHEHAFIQALPGWKVSDLDTGIEVIRNILAEG